MSRDIGGLIRLGRVYLPVRARLEVLEVIACWRCGAALEMGRADVVNTGDYADPWALACSRCVSLEDVALRQAVEAIGGERVQVVRDWQRDPDLAVPDVDPRGDAS